MKPTVESLLEQTLSVWKPTGNAEIDTRVLDLFHSDFFRRFQQATEQIVVVMDHREMRYLYISDNITAIAGYDREELYKKGAMILAEKCHPDDLQNLPLFFPAMVNAIRTVPAEEVLNCRMSYDYRLLFADDQYHWVMQHNIPLTLDEHHNIVHGLLILSDITPYKRNPYCCYKVVNYHFPENPCVLLEGMMGDPQSQKITRREREIIQFIAAGIADRQIAERLSISVHTVKAHRKNLLKKTGVNNAPELVSFAMANLII
jgi:DNA-binding CsgD family transcriptional regulator